MVSSYKNYNYLDDDKKLVVRREEMSLGGIKGTFVLFPGEKGFRAAAGDALQNRSLPEVNLDW